MKKLAYKLKYIKESETAHSTNIIIIYRGGEVEIKQIKKTLFDSDWFQDAQDGWSLGDCIGDHRNDLLTNEVKTKLNDIFSFEFISTDIFDMDFTVDQADLSELSKNEIESIEKLKISQIEKMDPDSYPFEITNNENVEKENELDAKVDSGEAMDPAGEAWKAIINGNGHKHGID